MRSFDRAMPEELNRVLCDHASDLLLCPSQTAVDEPAREGGAGEVVLVGDVMVDVANLFQPRARETRPRALRHSSRPYVLATAHRAGNVDDPARLAALVELLSRSPRTSCSRCTRGRARGSRPPACSIGWRGAVRAARAAGATWTSPRCSSTRARC